VVAFFYSKVLIAYLIHDNGLNTKRISIIMWNLAKDMTSLARASCLIELPPNRLYLGVSDMRVNNISTTTMNTTKSKPIYLVTKQGIDSLESNSKLTCFK
jgi:hypothetical protein